jgi:hypothetical protein
MRSVAAALRVEGDVGGPVEAFGEHGQGVFGVDGHDPARAGLGDEGSVRSHREADGPVEPTRTLARGPGRGVVRVHIAELRGVVQRFSVGRDAVMP